MKTLFTLILLLLALPNLYSQLRFFEFDFHDAYPDSLNLFAATSDAAVLADVDAQLALSEHSRHKHINGKIDNGTGTNNPRYSWHFVNNEWLMAEVSIEVCDGRPKEDVEADTGYWISTIGYFCPWNSYVKREVAPTGIDDRLNEIYFSISPNPANKWLEISNRSASSIDGMILMNVNGQVMKEWDPLQRGKLVQYDIAWLENGLYFLALKTGGSFVVKKFVKE